MESFNVVTTVVKCLVRKQSAAIISDSCPSGCISTECCQSAVQQFLPSVFDVVPWCPNIVVVAL